MYLNNYLKSKIHLIGALSLLFGLASCGSYQYAGQNEDSVYGDSERTVERPVSNVEIEPATKGSDYYQNYFKEKSQQLDNLSEDDVIFTDIDSYSGDYDVENDSITYTENYAGWGQDNDDVTINIYGGSAFYNPWNSLFYPSWRWNYGYGYGWGYGFNDFYWCPPYWGSYYSAWNYPYYGYGNYYGGYYGNHYNGYYNRRGLAYNAGRRGSIYSNSLSGLTNRRSVTNRSLTSRSRQSAITNGRTATSRRSEATSRSSRSENVDANTRERLRRNSTNTSSRETRPRSSTTRPRTTTRTRTTTRPKTRTSKPRTTTRQRTTTSRPRTTTSRSSSPSRSSSSRSSGRSSSSRRGNK